MRGRTRATVIAAAVLAAVLAPTAAFAAAPQPNGGDVSWYQGTTSLPQPASFEVIGVNAGRPTDPNVFLAQQIAWARAAGARVDVYVASANPGVAGTWWPGSDRTKAGKAVRSPYGSCSARKATLACAWIYGNSYGRDDVHADVSGPIGTWWIDVENGVGGNTWSTSTARNRAVLEGMVAGLEAGKQQVGIYALSKEFTEVLGTVPASSSIAKLPSWVAGAADQDAALQRCSGSSLTSGRLRMVQWSEANGTIDHDVACGTLTQPRPTVSGHHRVGSTLTARLKTWGPGPVHRTYRWTRDGHPIAGATRSTYRLQRSDARHRVGVVVTGTETGYSRAVQRSTTARVAS